ncbi:hypothetical protein [Phormidesmis priestleyi]|uniref:hypothetical protein n=1 Tax=Phormidesmis priestleyi TaxID=268141 RepID=UPI0011603837|nr:hypothetical protein [Phormidesmis priestleyi]
MVRSNIALWKLKTVFFVADITDYKCTLHGIMKPFIAVIDPHLQKAKARNWSPAARFRTFLSQSTAIANPTITACPDNP